MESGLVCNKGRILGKDHRSQDKTCKRFYTYAYFYNYSSFISVSTIQFYYLLFCIINISDIANYQWQNNRLILIIIIV